MLDTDWLSGCDHVLSFYKPLKQSYKAGNDISSILLKFSRWVTLIIHKDLTERDAKHKILQQN